MPELRSCSNKAETAKLQQQCRNCKTAATMPELQNCSNNAGTAKNTPKLRFLAKMVEKFESSRCNISTVKKCNKAQSLKFQHFTFYYIKFRAEISRQNSTKIVKNGRNGGISPATIGWRRHGQSASKSGRRHGQPASKSGRRHGQSASKSGAGTAISRATPLREAAWPAREHPAKGAALLRQAARSSQDQHCCGRRHGHLKSSAAAAGGTVKAAALPSTGG